MKHLWFRAKRSGWGWHPARWQGWLVLIFYSALVALDFRRIDAASHSASDTLINFIPETFVLTLILILICHKTGENPKWRWD